MFFWNKGKKKKEILTLPQNLLSVDMHLHLLPGIDDGAPDVETSLNLARQMVSWGISEAYVTPHINMDVYPNTPKLIRERVQQLQIELDKEGIDLKIYPGAEYMMGGDFLDILEKGDLQPIDNTYLLVENSFYQETPNIHDVFFKIELLGYQPILAHPERYKYYHRDINSYKRLKDTGCLFQINVLSLAGWYGEKEKKMAEYLVEKEYVDFLGTDMHKPVQATTISAYLKHSKTFEKIAKKVNKNKTLSKKL